MPNYGLRKPATVLVIISRVQNGNDISTTKNIAKLASNGHWSRKPVKQKLDNRIISESKRRLDDRSSSRLHLAILKGLGFATRNYLGA
jgi:hypothetical protein